MKQQILQLRSEGKTYNEIQQLLGCSKSTISYHCGKGQKEKTAERQRKHRANDEHIIIKKKIESFSNRDTQKLRVATSDFKRGSKRDQNNKPLFSYKDVIEKFGIETQCYLTGVKINLLTDYYHFDHKIPVSQGGDNSLSNLGIASPLANLSKSSMTFEEYVCLCKQVLIHNGYMITKD